MTLCGWQDVKIQELPNPFKSSIKGTVAFLMHVLSNRQKRQRQALWNFVYNTLLILYSIKKLVSYLWNLMHYTFKCAGLPICCTPRPLWYSSMEVYSKVSLLSILLMLPKEKHDTVLCRCQASLDLWHFICVLCIILSQPPQTIHKERERERERERIKTHLWRGRTGTNSVTAWRERAHNTVSRKGRGALSEKISSSFFFFFDTVTFFPTTAET